MRCSDDAEKPKNAPQVFQDFQSSNQHGTVVKSHFFKKNVRFMGTVSGPAGCLCILCIYIYIYSHVNIECVLQNWLAHTLCKHI